LDENGKPTGNPKRFWTYVNNWKANKRNAKQMRKDQENKKKKF